MKRVSRSAWLLVMAVPFAAAVAVSIALAGGREMTESEARDAAYAALGLADGSCTNGAEISRRKPDPQEVDREVRGASGWAHGMFVGSRDALASDLGASEVSRTPMTTWFLVIMADEQRAIYEYHSQDLPSGRKGWLLGDNAQTTDC